MSALPSVALVKMTCKITEGDQEGVVDNSYRVMLDFAFHVGNGSVAEKIWGDFGQNDKHNWDL